MRVCANQLVRSSEPSTPSVKSFCALIWASQLIGGVSKDAPVAAFLKESVISGLACCPAPDLILPSRSSIQRPVPSSRALICATRLRSLRRAAKCGCRQRAYLSTSVSAKRMTDSLSCENIVRFLTLIDARMDRRSPAKAAGATAVSSRLYVFRPPVHTLRFDRYQLPWNTGFCLATKACLLYTSDAADEEDSVDL